MIFDDLVDRGTYPAVIRLQTSIIIVIIVFFFLQLQTKPAKTYQSS